MNEKNTLGSTAGPGEERCPSVKSPASKLRERLVVRPGARIRLRDFDPARTDGVKGRKPAQAALEEQIARLDQLQYLLYAETSAPS